MSKTILCAVDFTDASDVALGEVVQLAAELGAEVTVLHVYAVPSFVLPEGAVIPSAEDAARISEDAQRRLDEIVRRHDRTGVRVSGVLRCGTAWEEICKLGDELDAAIVAVGMHSSGPLRRALLGSVASKVIRVCSRPVLTVPAHPARGETMPRR